MSSAELDERDPDNRLLARQSRFRVDAEIVRDIALSVSGLLVEKFGGPSVKPLEPDGYLATLNFPKREYSASRGDDLYRRGVYTFWQRSFLHPSLLTFDAPTREECTVNRVNSNTPAAGAGPAQRSHLRGGRARLRAEHPAPSRRLECRMDWAFERAAEPRTRGRTNARILSDLYRRNLARVPALRPTSARPHQRRRSARAPRISARRTRRHDHRGARHSQHARNHYEELEPMHDLDTSTAAPSCATDCRGSDCWA